MKNTSTYQERVLHVERIAEIRARWTREARALKPNRNVVSTVPAPSAPAVDFPKPGETLDLGGTTGGRKA